MLSLQASVQNPKLYPYQSREYNSKTTALSSNKRIHGLKCHSEFHHHQSMQLNIASGSSSTAAAGDGDLPRRIFVGHSLYKAETALVVEPCAPEFTALDSGAFKISKEGYLRLQFAPALAVRQYDWSRKQVFSLSVVEIGTLISLGAKESCEFFHDPYMGRSEEGKIKKLLKVEPLSDGSGCFINLSVQNKLLDLDENFYIPITKEEFAVLISAFSYILPYLLGWHSFSNSTRADDNVRSNNARPRHRRNYNRRIVRRQLS